MWFSNRRARLRKHLNSQQLATLTSPMAPSAAAAAAAASAAAAAPYMTHHQYPGQMCDPSSAMTASAAYHGELLIASLYLKVLSMVIYNNINLKYKSSKVVTLRYFVCVIRSDIMAGWSSNLLRLFGIIAKWS